MKALLIAISLCTMPMVLYVGGGYLLELGVDRLIVAFIGLLVSVLYSMTVASLAVWNKWWGW